MTNFRKIRNYVIGLSIILDIFTLFSIGSSFFGRTISNKTIDFGWYCIFVSVFLVFVWFWADDNKEKYPKTESIVNNIVAILFMFPWVSAVIISIFN